MRSAFRRVFAVAPAIAAVLIMGAADAAMAQVDTTLAAAAGGRLVIDADQAAVRVNVWDRAEVRVLAPRGPAAPRIRQAGDTVRIAAAMSAGTFEITVPRRFGVQVGGRQVSVLIEQVDGRILVETLLGDTEVRGGTGPLRVETLTGAIRVDGRSGAIDVSSTNFSIHVADSQGAIIASAVNGEIRLTGNRSASIKASTVNGSIELEGGVVAGGEYDLTTHNATITLALPADANVDVEATTVWGTVQSDIPVELRSSGRGRYQFTLGEGGARIRAQTFNGGIRVRRPGTARPAAAGQRQHGGSR